MANNEYQKMMFNILGTKPIAFNADLAHALGSAKAGLFLSQLLFWCDKGKNPNWIYKTIEDFERETALTRNEQDTAIKICKKYGTIRVERKGIPAKRHFQINTQKIIELLEAYCSSLQENHKQVCRKMAIKIEPKKQSNTENTHIKNKEIILSKNKLAEFYKNGDRTYKPFFKGDEMRWNKIKRKWYVIQNQDWLEFSLSEENIEWIILNTEYTP